jgi:hypothetical protein
MRRHRYFEISEFRYFDKEKAAAGRSGNIFGG